MPKLRLVVFLHFDKHAVENAQKAILCMIPIYANLASWHQISILSETTRLFRHLIGMLGTILERQKVMLSVFESHRNIPLT